MRILDIDGKIVFLLRSYWLIMLLILLPCNSSYAQIAGAGGIIIDMRTNARAMDILGLALETRTMSNGVIGDVLHVKSKNKERIINVPMGSLPLIMDFERHYNRNELIVSADNYLFGSSPDGPIRMVVGVASKDADSARKLVAEQAADLGVEKKLALTLLNYDVYANDVICGATPPDITSAHPLALEDLPQAAVSKMLTDPQHGAELSKLLYAFSAPPTCVGQLSLSYDGSSAGVAVRTWRWFIGYHWDREMIVLDEPQRAIADRAYVHLGNDIERRWGIYRRAFRPLDELSSVVEALVTLRAVRTGYPRLYQDLQHQISKLREPDWRGPQPSASLPLTLTSEKDWHTLLVGQVGKYMQTENDVEIALAVKMYRWSILAFPVTTGVEFEIPSSWESGIKRIEQKAAGQLASKILLVRALEAPPSISLPMFSNFFDSVRRQNPESLGLWLQSLRLLKIYCNDIHRTGTIDHQRLLQQQRIEALAAATQRMQQILDKATSGPDAATQFLGIAFGTRLLDLTIWEWGSRDEDRKLDDPRLETFVEQLAKVHWLAIRELQAHNADRMLILAHHRYLGYLADLVPKARPVIDKVRNDILSQLASAH